jgi:dynein heavy chain
MSPNSDPLLLLTNEALKAEWNQQGLPPDIVSIENGTILVNSERYSLIIDPQPQGISCIKEKEKKNNFQVIRLGNKTLVNTLEMSIEKERLLRTA